MRLDTNGKEYRLYIPSSEILKSIDSTEDGDWIFEGIASNSSVDLFNDVVYPSSFHKTIDFFKENGHIFYNHDYAKNDSELYKSYFTKDELIDLKSPIGRPLDAKITPEGLYIKAKLNKKHPIARKVWHEFLTNPDPDFRKGIGLSIGAKPLGPIERKYDFNLGKYVNVLPDLLLYEVSLTTTPVNPETKAWASVLKSMISDSETETMTKTEQIIQLTPEESFYDPKLGKMVVKSVVENENGELFVFEQYVDLPASVRKAFGDDDAEGEDDGADSAPADDGADAPPADDAAPAPDAGAADAGAPADPAADPMGGAPAPDPMAGGADPMAGGAPADPMAGGAPADPMADPMGGAGAGDPMAAGAGDPGAMPDPMADAGGDSSQSLILDKLDTVVDALTTIAQDMANLTQGGNLSAPSDTTPPAPDVNGAAPNDALMKSIESLPGLIASATSSVELSTKTEENLRSVIKSVIQESLPDIAQAIAAALGGNIVKSADTIVNPGVSVSSVSQNVTVIKSMNGQTLDTAIFKSLMNEYVAITGRGEATSQRRANVLVKAEEQLKITSDEFKRLVNRYSK